MPKIVDHDERRERIVEIVAEMLATVGAEKTTIREIARQSGYSRGFIEHYFHNKEELITKTIRWINERSLARADAALAGKTGLAALKVFCELSLPVTPQVRNEWKIRMQFWGMAAVSDEHEYWPYQGEFWRDELGTFSYTLTKGCREGPAGKPAADR